jgi:NifU-like protein involved in Fe-S cluster formation
MGLFTPVLLEHFKHPRHTGSLPVPDGEGWSGDGQASSRFMRIQVQVAQGRIADARFATYGCAPAIACGSFLCDWAIGKTVSEAMTCSADALETALGGLPEARRFCARLATDALQAALTSLPTHRRGPQP